MTDAPSNATSNAWAARVAATLVAGFVLVAAFTFYDHAHRAALERVEEPTAVGDTHFAKPPPNANATVGKFEGKNLFVEKSVKARDSKMLRAGREENGAFAVYRSAEPDDGGVL